MPEVKVQWVPAGVVLLYNKPDNKPLNPRLGLSYAPTPVLTLDQIEAWLAKQPRYMTQPDYSMKRNDKSRFVDVDDLLAQVQAWKESK